MKPGKAGIIYRGQGYRFLKTFSLTRLRHTLEEIGFIVEESTAVFHYPHPDGLVRMVERSLRKLSRGKLDNAIRKGLAFLDRLEGKRTKYLTGRYIAVKAVKPSD